MQTGSITVGTTALPVPVTETLTYGVTLLSDAANDEVVYFSTNPSVNATAGSADAGYPLGDGLTDFIPAEDLRHNTLYVIAGGAGQTVFWKAS